MKVAIEVCVEGVTSALEAVAGGADRVELCENRAIGGVTPSAGALWIANRGNRPVQVLIRPRGGDFAYHAPELEAMRKDVEVARELGASGVVLGVLDREGRVDRARTGWLIEAARPMSVTFHKAFDAARDPFEALDDLIGLGVDRVLTSGRAPTAREGVGLLAELARRAGDRVAILAGGSIAEGDVRPLIDAGLREIHVGSAACRDGVTDRELVRRIVRAASVARIVHLTTRPEWDRAVAEGRSYRAGSLATEGFIHASNPSQVAGSANRFFRGRADLVALMIDPDRVRSPIRREPSPHSDVPFPHIYGPLELEAVVDVVALEPDARGEFAWPPG